MKDVGLRIRVQRELREQFLEACRKEDKPAAQVLREFMRSYVAAHPVDTAAPDLESDADNVTTKKLHGGKAAP